MKRYQHIERLVARAYTAAEIDFAHWIWHIHVPVVARIAEQLSVQYHADVDLAVAGAWLHDFGDAFVERFAENHDEVTRSEATKVLQHCGYSASEIEIVLNQVIKPHSCRDGNFPSTIEGKVVATADALAHLTTDFYVQCSWKHLPEGKSYAQFLEWVNEKLDRDYHTKIFWGEVRLSVTARYEALEQVFRQTTLPQ